MWKSIIADFHTRIGAWHLLCYTVCIRITINASQHKKHLTQHDTKLRGTVRISRQETYYGAPN